MWEDDGYINGSVVQYSVPAEVMDQVNLLLISSSNLDNPIMTNCHTSDVETVAE